MTVTVHANSNEGIKESVFSQSVDRFVSYVIEISVQVLLWLLTNEILNYM